MKTLGSLEVCFSSIYFGYCLVNHFRRPGMGSGPNFARCPSQNSRHSERRQPSYCLVHPRVLVSYSRVAYQYLQVYQYPGYMLGNILLGYIVSSFLEDSSVVVKSKYPQKIKHLDSPEVPFLAPLIFLKLGVYCLSVCSDCWTRCGCLLYVSCVKHFVLHSM